MPADLSRLPRVDRVLGHPALDPERGRLGDALLAELVREAIDAARRVLLSDEAAIPPDEAAVAAEVRRAAAALRGGHEARVINATGVFLHTNLGRAPLSARARAATLATLDGATAIELDLATGKRGRRGAFAQRALCVLSGAEAALVVNNCAAAVLLLLAATARGRAVIVSRGELIEIGGGFRVPEIMEESGARLIEVGTTNKTRLDDYARALDAHPDAAAILRVHQGNFRQLGFVERPELRELGALARARGVPLLKDLGGGALVDLGRAGFSGEPTVEACVRAGCDAVAFSCDKVLGGPQGGALVGRRAVLERASRHPLARAFRLGRLPLVALEATLESYLLGRAWEELPVLARAIAPIEGLERRAEALSARLAEGGVAVAVVASEVEMGGGALAGRTIPSRALVFPGGDPLLAALRAGAPPVLARAARGQIWIDLRTVAPEEDPALCGALLAAVREFPKRDVSG